MAGQRKSPPPPLFSAGLMTVSGRFRSVRMAVSNGAVRLWVNDFGAEKLGLMECHTLEVY